MKHKQQQSFWGLKPVRNIKRSTTTPTPQRKQTPSPFWNNKPMPKCKYRSGMPVKLFGDKDRDGVMNVFDCKPRNKRMQDRIPITKYYKKYPNLRTVKVIYGYPPAAGEWHPDTNTIVINPNQSFSEQVKTLAHEAKHVEQYKRHNHQLKHLHPSVRVQMWNESWNDREYNYMAEKEAANEEELMRYGMPAQLFADKDKDGVPNVFDCNPRDKRRQDSRMLRQQIGHELYGKLLQSKTPEQTEKRMKRYRRYVHQQLKEKNPEGYKTIGKQYKVVTPAELVKTFAKDPTLYAEYKKTKPLVRTSAVKEWLKEIKKDRKKFDTSATTYEMSPRKSHVVLSPVIPIKEDVRKILKHEDVHVKQPLTEMDAERKIIEKQIRRKLKYREKPAEIEAFEEQEKPTIKEQQAEYAEEIPEVLQTLDDDGSMIDDTIEDITDET